MQFRLSVLAAGLAIGVGGCVPGITIASLDIAVPARFSGANPGPQAYAPRSEWWLGFHLPELSRLAQATVADNFDIAAARARITQARAAATLAGVPLLPSLTLNSSVTHSKSSAFDGPRNPREQTDHQLGLNAAYEVDFWGKNAATADASAKSLLASQFDAETIRLSSLAATANGYLQVLANRERLTLVRENLKVALSVLTLINQRLAAGTASALDQAQQQSVVDNLRANIPPLQLGIVQNSAALALLVGQTPETTKVGGAGIKQARLPRVSPGLPSQLLLRRPDIAFAEAQLQANAANLVAARAAFFPSIQLTAQGGFQSFALNTLLDPKNTFYSIAASLTQPIFDNGKLQSTFDQTKGRQDELLANYRKAVISAFVDVEKALASIRYLAAQEALQRKSLASSQKAYDLSGQRFREGTLDLVTLLNTQNSLFQTKDALVQTRLARLQAIVSLYQALGGGWNGAENLASITR